MSAIHAKRQLGSSSSAALERNAAYERIARLISELRYGTVEITIHDGRVVQIERTEKIRLPNESVGDAL